MTDRFAALTFAPCPPAEAPATAAAQIKVALLARGQIKCFLDARAYQRLGKPAALVVDTAADEDGRGYLRLAPAAEGGGLAGG